MKKSVFIILFTTSIVVACSNHESMELESVTTKSGNVKSNIRSYEEALAIAQASIPMLESSKITRSIGKTRKIDLNDKKVFKIDAKTRANSNLNDTLIYVFNFEDNAGFALISASKNTCGLLAVTEQGYCDPDTHSENEGFEMFKLMAKEYVYEASTMQQNPIGPYVETKDSITYVITGVGPYATVKWGQVYPEGEYCTNGISGCTNTAMAQIMSYYNYPTSIDLTYPEADISVQNLDWISMNVHTTGHTLYECGIPNTHRAIGRLLRQLGEMNHSTYKSNPLGTSTNMTYAKPTFTALGYTCGSWAEYKGSTTRLQLNRARLFLVQGFCLTNTGPVGHCWMLDGYKTIKKIIRKMARTETSGWFFTGDVSTETNNYLHYNWGWYGDCNGYFAEGVYDTSQEIHNIGDELPGYDFNINVSFLNVYH